VIGPYLDLLRLPYAARLAASTALYGLAAVGTFVPIVFFAREATGSYAGASAILAAVALGQALTNPWRGRLVDRRGPRRTLPLFAVALLATTAALLVAGRAHAPLLALVPIAFLTGVAAQTPGVVLRSIWGRITEGAERSTSFAFLTVMHELTNVAGPMAGALLLLLSSPTAAVAICMVIAAAASTWFAFSPGADIGERTEPRERWSLGPLVSPGFRAVLAMAFFYGLTFGQLEDIALPAFAVEHGSRASAGILLAAIAVGIGVGGFSYGLRKWTRPAGELMPAVSGLALAGTIPSLFPSSIPAMAAAMLLFGLCIAPISTLQFAVIDDVAPPGSGTEAFGWLASAALVGAAGGAVIAGRLVDAHGPKTALAGVVAASALGFLVAVAARRPLAARLSPRGLS
jgi:predicted MFS family arabinose efflux permease